MSALADRVRALRERIGVNQSELADAAGISRAALSTLEAGGERHGVTLRTLRGIAEALDVPVAVLVGERRPAVDWPVDQIKWRQIRREVEAVRTWFEEVA